MATPKNSAGLHVVNATKLDARHVELLLIANGKPARRVRVEEHDVTEASIDMMLHKQCLLSLSVEGSPCLSAAVLWHGGKQHIVGRVGVPSASGAEIIVPRGTFAKWHA